MRLGTTRRRRNDDSTNDTAASIGKLEPDESRNSKQLAMESHYAIPAFAACLAGLPRLVKIAPEPVRWLPPARNAYRRIGMVA